MVAIILLVFAWYFLPWWLSLPLTVIFILCMDTW
jgi:hypothetical protein